MYCEHMLLDSLLRGLWLSMIHAGQCEGRDSSKRWQHFTSSWRSEILHHVLLWHCSTGAHTQRGAW